MYANFQPLWTMPDKGLAAAELLLGAERSKRQYPIKAMLSAGVKVCLVVCVRCVCLLCARVCARCMCVCV